MAESFPETEFVWWVPINGLMLLVCKKCASVVPRHGASAHYIWHAEMEARDGQG